jgi:hypothetical protein
MVHGINLSNNQNENRTLLHPAYKARGRAVGSSSESAQN